MGKGTPINSVGGGMAAGAPGGEAVAARLLRESGNAFHCKVANAFRKRGWATLIGSYYVDASTDKAREIDLIVEKSYVVPQHFSAQYKTIRLRLFIECKYIANTTLFWFDSRDDDKAYGWIQRNTPIPKRNSYVAEHHHLQEHSSVAKLFASEKGSEDSDPIFRATNQCLSGYVQTQRTETLIPRRQGEHTTMLEYPVLVFSGFDRFYRTNIATGDAPVPIVENFHLEVDYAYVNRSKAFLRDYFLLDMVSFLNLDAFIRCLEREVKAVTHLLVD